MMRNPLGVTTEATPRVPRALHCHQRMLLSVITAAYRALGRGRRGPNRRTAHLRLRCTNPASGTSWPIVVDLDHGTVDSLAATINRSWISWHDPKQGFFDLDRATGKLQLRNASSTGGYFLYYTCRPE